ncbi:hypothetical protein NC661_04730 [Aquibacillus koreensis]|uniref:Uncharacterized protein n=1 Tax=Aquibacillus koreensis TaxID=279446 RepID=A0A9X3WJD9_9BACI|nr:hypothetical protein [Aquibacillus koreensis]MCT2534720.1 hypothetical protein [Aquibacillus koreensis]MDC3419670.1 hypothetical protein [Aquibacillus koreensis]
MEKIIQQNNDQTKMKYLVITFFSLLTLRKLKRVEKYRKELKAEVERQELDNDFHKL